MSETNPSPPAPSNYTPLIAGCLGAIVALIAVGLILIWQSRDHWPEITADTLSAAQMRWQDTQSPSYRLKLKLIGPLAGEVEVTVHQGEPTDLVRDGQEVKETRTWKAWTVEGLMHLIRLDLDSVAAEGRDFLYLSGEFDARSGLPRHYRRVHFDPPQETGWDIIEWTPEAE